MEEIKVHGNWVSPFSFRVICALKLKGVSHQYVEEDIFNKSNLLLQYNPVHKKVPVLVHDGKPICESLVILEYIEQTWPDSPLLPTNPYDRAIARFWAKFVDDKGPLVWTMFQTTGEDYEKLKKDSLEMLHTLDEHALGSKKFFGGENIGLVDLAFGGYAFIIEMIEAVLDVKLLDEEYFPRLVEWTKNFKEVAVIKETLPDRERMLVRFKKLRATFIQSPSQN